ncbi:MAG: carboxy terminal-processing peptidase [Bacteroidales bacterium]|nr:carboxy terminal-processing peptidase [Bacteroidales bacterium]
MKNTKTGIFIPIAIIALISISFLYSFCKRSEKDEVLMQMNLQLLKMQHFNPPEINDQFSEKAFIAYLKKMDPAKLYLTQEDIQEMSEYKFQIDDQLNRGTYELYDLSIKILDKRYTETKGYYHELLSGPFDFSQNENYETNPDKTDWPSNSIELKDAWRKELKYRTLANLSNALKAQDNATDSIKGKSYEELESDARKRILKSYDDMFTYRSKLRDEDRFSLYINAITSVFDPHTQYQTPSDKESFDIQISGQFEGIGAQLSPSDGYAKVIMLIPGSPSWKQGELKVNDLITKVKQENEEEAVDIFGMLLDDAVKLIRGKKGTKVTLTVKRADGSVHDITITRDVVIDEETYAKSAVLTDSKNKIKVGYIYLPSFYVDFKQTATGRSSSDDVAKEIEKLKKENVQGIMLDLRSNGGGSLSDAIRMSGLFVDQGPVVQTKYNIGLPRVLTSDASFSSSYDGPLVILVNTLSASASEILAAAMQDYQRAIIIGGPSTFGKGTVQAIADLDELVANNPALSKLKPLGSLKMTIQKFYRVNGGSTQLKGVTPDIILPDLYSELGIGERFEDNCLPWTSIQPAQYKVWKNPVAVKKVQKKSYDRTSKNKAFKLLSEQVDILKQMREESSVPLNIDEFRKIESKRSEESKRFDELSKNQTSLNIAILNEDQAAIVGDTAKISRYEKWIEDLNKDIFLEEAVSVIGDMKNK